MRHTKRILLPTFMAILVANLPLVSMATPASVEVRIAASTKVNILPKALNPSLSDIHSKGSLWFSGSSLISSVCDPYGHPDQASNPTACMLGDKTATRTVVLWGDSNAGNWMPLFDQVFKTLKYRVAAYVFPGCPGSFVTVAKTGAFVSSKADACNLFHAKLAASVRALQPNAIFGVSGAAFLTKTPTAEQQWVNGWKIAFDALAKSSPATKRFLIGTSPIMPQNVPTCLALHSNAIQTCGLNVSKGYYPGHIARDAKSATASKATMIPVAQWFCQNNLCPPILNSILIYVDEDHTSTAFVSELVAPWLAYLRTKGF